MGKSTLDYIVKLTGYSKTSISRVINGKAEEYRISVTARDKILKAAKEVNYRPNFFAQNLRKKSNKTIGLVIPHIDNPFFANLSSIIISEAQKYDYTVIFIDTQENPKLEEKALDSMITRNLDGIILVPCGDNPTRLEEISKNIPLMLVDRYFENSNLSYVSTDNYDGAYQATKLLLDSGHKNILCIQGPVISVTTKERLRGCHEAVRDAGGYANLEIRGNEFSIRNGYIETKLVLSSNPRPTAIFALSNTILLGAIGALKEHNIAIPEEISLISFDDNLFLDYLNPPITRIAQPISNLGIVAIKLLIQKINNNTNVQSTLLLHPNIIKRDSVKLIIA